MELTHQPNQAVDIKSILDLSALWQMSVNPEGAEAHDWVLTNNGNFYIYLQPSMADSNFSPGDPNAIDWAIPRFTQGYFSKGFNKEVHLSGEICLEYMITAKGMERVRDSIFSTEETGMNYVDASTTNGVDLSSKEFVEHVGNGDWPLQRPYGTNRIEGAPQHDRSLKDHLLESLLVTPKQKELLSSFIHNVLRTASDSKYTLDVLADIIDEIVIAPRSPGYINVGMLVPVDLSFKNIEYTMNRVSVPFKQLSWHRKILVAGRVLRAFQKARKETNYDAKHETAKSAERLHKVTAALPQTIKTFYTPSTISA